MPNYNRKLDLSNIHAVIGAIQPELSRTDNKIMQLNGHPADVFLVKTSGTTETNLNLQSSLVKVLGGVVINMTTGTVLPIAVTALSSNASIAVVNAVLPDLNEYLVICYGNNIA